jgi:flavin-dependent dehydrogenase
MEHTHEPVRVDILIVGAGPAGTSTALNLARIDPAWTRRIAVVERAVHPRSKPCGGGITGFGSDALERLRLSLEPGHVPVREARLGFRRRWYALRGDPVFRVVHRARLDHWLVREARARGIAVHEGEAVRGMRRVEDGFEVDTARRCVHARAVVGADGAGSVVRRALRWPRGATHSRLFETLTPEDAAHPAWTGGVAAFDFTPAAAGIQGYFWDFPSWIDGAPVMNRGVFDSGVHGRRSGPLLRGELDRCLRVRGVGDAAAHAHGFPLRPFESGAPLSRFGVVLAGEAAGVDPLFGEGIAFALVYGEVAAQTLAGGFARGDLSFEDYAQRVHAHPVLSQLRLRARLARWFYRAEHPWTIGAMWAMAGVVLRLLAWRHPESVPLECPALVRIPPPIPVAQ